MEHEGDNYTNCDWCVWNSNKRIIKGPGGFRSWRPCGDYPNNSIIENGQNTEKSPGDLRRLAGIQTPVRDHQLTLLWKTRKEYNNNKTPMGFWHTNGLPILGWKTRPNNNQQQQKENFQIVDLAVPVDHTIKLKDCEKKDKYEDHCIGLQTFFVWALLLIVHTRISSPLLRLQCTCCTVPTTSGRPHGSPLVWACQWHSLHPLSSPQFSHSDSLWA